MKKILSLIVGLFLVIPAIAGGQQYFEHCKSLYNSGRYEEARQGFTMCKVYADIDNSEMDTWISYCDYAIAQKRNRIAAAASARTSTTSVTGTKQDSNQERQFSVTEKNLVYISADAWAFDSEYKYMGSAVKGKLQQLKFSKNEDGARWGVYIAANAREHSNPETNPAGVYVVYVDAMCQVVDLTTGEIVFEQVYSQKKGSGNQYKAVEMAYTALVPIIASDISGAIESE